MTFFVGIDPGASGGIAAIRGFELGKLEAEIWKMPETERDLWDVFRLLRGENGSWALIEKVGANRMAAQGERRQGASTMFSFGRNYGLLRGMLVASEIPFADAAPQSWLKEFGLRREKDETDASWKNRHKAIAQQLFPATRVTHAVADALLIAEYARRNFSGEQGKIPLAPANAI